MSEKILLPSFAAVVEYLRENPGRVAIIIGFGRYFVYAVLDVGESSLKFDHVTFCRQHFANEISASGLAGGKIDENCHKEDVFFQIWVHPDRAVQRERRLVIRTPWCHRIGEFDPAIDAWSGFDPVVPDGFYSTGR